MIAKILDQAQNQLLNKQFDDCEKTLNQIRPLAVGIPLFWNILGNLYLNKYQNDIAAEALERAIFLLPEFPPNYASLGHAYMKMEKYDLSISNYQKFIDYQGSPMVHPHHVALVYNDIGYCYGQMNKPKKVIEVCNKAILLDPYYSHPYNSIGLAYNKLKEYEEAISYFKKGIDVDPNYKEAWGGMGYSYYCLKKYDESKKAHWKALEIDRNYGRSWLGLANIFSVQENYNDSFICLAMSEYTNREMLLKTNISTFFDLIVDLEESYLGFRVLVDIREWQSFLVHNEQFSRIYETFSKTHFFLMHIEQVLEKENQIAKFRYIEGLIKYHINDPINCFEIFNEHLDTEENEDNMQIQYYLMLSAFNTNIVFKEYQVIREDVKQICNRLYLQIDGLEDIQVYYIGLSYQHFGHTHQAISCFEKIQDFIPAKIALAYALIQIKKDPIPLIEDLLSLNKTTNLLEYLNYKGFNVKKDPMQQVLKFVFCREIDQNISVIQEYLYANKETRSDFDWEKVSFRYQKPQFSDESYEYVQLQYRALVEKEARKLKEKLNQDKVFNDECFSYFLDLTGDKLEDKIGNRIKEKSNQLGEHKDNFLDAITYFHLQKWLDHNQKIRLTYWFFSQYYLSALEHQNLKIGIKMLMNMIFSHFCNPLLTFIPETLALIFNEASSITMGKAVESMLGEKKDFPKTYDLFKERLIDS